MSKYVFFPGPNAGKYGPGITPYLDTFRAVYYSNQHVNLNVLFQRSNLQLSETFGFDPLAKTIKLSFSIMIILITTTLVL